MACWRCEYCKTRNCDTDVCLNPRCPTNTAYTETYTRQLLVNVGVVETDKLMQGIRRVGVKFDKSHVDTVVEVMKARQS